MGEYMGTHPIFESDFDCLTECSQGRSFPAVSFPFPRLDVTVTRPKTRARVTETGFTREKTPDGTCTSAPRRNTLTSSKTLTAGTPKSKRARRQTPRCTKSAKKANRWTPGPYAPKSWVTENIYEANYFWPRHLKHTVSRYKDVNLAHKSYEEANILKYHILFLKIGLVLAFVLEMPPIMIYVWKENRA